MIDYMIHHLLSHSDGADWLTVNRFFMEQMAHVGRRLDAIQEGERTTPDESIVMMCWSMMTGTHKNDQLPLVMLGRAGGRIETGHVLDYTGKPDRQMSRLYLSLIEKMGVREKAFGDASAPLDEV